MEIAVTGLLVIVFITLGLPIAFSILIPSIAALFFFLGGMRDLLAVGQLMYTGLHSYTLLAVPLFILMGNVMVRSGAAQDLFELVSVWLRHLPGGLAIAAVGGCALFAGVSGSSAATAATIGVVSLNQMHERGYPQSLAAGTVATSGGLGILIPPSIPLLLYALVTNESPGQLFMAGVIPGLLSAAFYMVYISASVSWSRSVAPVPKASWEERIRATRASIWSVSAIPLVLGGIYIGWFTPTEAAAVGLTYALLVGLLITRRLKLTDLLHATKQSTQTVCMIMFILAAAMLFGHVMTRLGLAGQIFSFVQSFGLSKWMLLGVLVCIFLALGCFLDPASLILITIPVLLPVLIDAGINLVWFAIILVKCLEIGLITPPVGMNLFILQGISPGLKFGVLMRGIAPFLLVELALILVLILVPQLSLWLPSLLG